MLFKKTDDIYFIAQASVCGEALWYVHGTCFLKLTIRYLGGEALVL